MTRFYFFKSPFFIAFFVGSGLLILSVPVNGVSAESLFQEVTPTVTITAPPPYQPDVNLPVTPVDLSCPAPGTPVVGWGTVTPDSSWQYLCSQCVVTPMGTSTPQPQNTLNPTQIWGTHEAELTTTSTPLATLVGTVTPVASFTPSPVTISCGGSYCTQISPQTVLFSGNIVSNGNPAYIDVWPYFVSQPNSHIWMKVTFNDIYYDHQFPSSGGITIELGEGYLLSLPISESCGSSYCTFHVISDTYYDFYRGDTTGYVKISGYVDNSGNPAMNNLYTWSGTSVLVSVDPSQISYPTPTPTPEVTPTPQPELSYCQTVSNNEQGFSWEGIHYGPVSCFDLPPQATVVQNGNLWDDFFEWLYPADGPWIAHVCMQDVSFGNADVFGVSVSLQTILYSLGVALIIRNMFVS